MPVRLIPQKQEEPIKFETQLNGKLPNGNFEGELHFGFKRSLGSNSFEVWFSPAPAINFTIPLPAGEKAVEVRVFEGRLGEKLQRPEKLPKKGLLPEVERLGIAAEVLYYAQHAINKAAEMDKIGFGTAGAMEKKIAESAAVELKNAEGIDGRLGEIPKKNRDEARAELLMAEVKFRYVTAAAMAEV